MKNIENLVSGQYDLDTLSTEVPALRQYIIRNPAGAQTIDFANPLAITLLNQSLLKYHFDILNWSVPEGHLIPAVPGRALYLLKLKEALGLENAHILDIGCGANVVYPLIGARSFNWSFVGTETSADALKVAKHIVKSNGLEEQIELKLQKKPSHILQGIDLGGKKFDACICNPPFYNSKEKASQERNRKKKNLKQDEKPDNFTGRAHELIYPGGEFQFVNNMIFESEEFRNDFKWFTTLVSKAVHLKKLVEIVKRKPITEHKIVDMQIGHKISRFLAWTYQ